MNKGRIDLSIDQDVLSWLRMNLERGEASSLVNDYLRAMMGNLADPSREELDRLKKEFSEMKEQSNEIIKEMAMKNSIIKKIESEIDKEETEAAAEVIREVDSIRRSGMWEEMTR